MRADDRRLRDILACADEIADYVDGIDRDAFKDDRMRQRAVTHLLIIIGEAAKNLSGETRAAIRQPWREIIRFRDRGVHAYETLDVGVLYGIATKSVPSLREAVADFVNR